MRVVRAIAVGSACTVAVGAMLGVAMPSAPAAEGETGIPVLGQAVTMGLVEAGDPGVLTVHGVRRVEKAALVYWSLAIPEGSEGSGSGFLGASTTSFFNDEIESQIADVALIDPVGQELYRPLVPSDQYDPCVCFGGASALQPGQAEVMLAAVTPLPEGVDVVDVVVGEQIIADVPVEDGPLEPPAKSQKEPILAGMGWPELDEKLLADAKQQEPAVFPLISRISDLEETVTTSEGEVALNADVLFAKDSADVAPDGKQAIARAATQIKEANPGNTITVVGHTDSDAGDQYNLDLSKRRAEAVAAELRTALGGSYTLTTDGKGESEPIASNDNDAGKAKNRRVTISYTEGS